MNSQCFLGALSFALLTGLGMSMMTPEHPEKPFREELVALRADNILLQEKVEAMLKAEIEAEKKRTAEAKSQCGK